MKSRIQIIIPNIIDLVEYDGRAMINASDHEITRVKDILNRMGYACTYVREMDMYEVTNPFVEGSE